MPLLKRQPGLHGYGGASHDVSCDIGLMRLAEQLTELDLISKDNPGRPRTVYRPELNQPRGRHAGHRPQLTQMGRVFALA